MEEAGPVPHARLTRLQLAIAALAIAFVVLSALVVGGALSSLDHYALVHWMPGLVPSRATEEVPQAIGIIRPFQLDVPWWQKVVDSYTYPASVFVSVVVFATGFVVLMRRGARTAAIVWVSAYVIANALEVVLKVGLARPDLYRSEDGRPYHIASFDHSFPSGHAMRAVLVAGIVAYVWTRFARPAWAWVALVPACLVLGSAHVPSDTAGGLLFGLLVVLLVYATLGALRERRA